MIEAQPVSYDDDGVPLSGVLVVDSDGHGRRPGILLVHGGAGLDQHAERQAARYAERGYAVLACDMFGQETRGSRERIMATIVELRDDPAKLYGRGLAGLQALASLPIVTGPAAAVGFCFGGMAVLALARQGAELAAAISIHGSLATSRPAQPGAVTAKVLVCHGALDPHVPMADVDAFVREMTEVDADWQLNVYGSALHGFTHESALPGATAGVRYDRVSDQRSFLAAANLLTEALLVGW